MEHTIFRCTNFTKTRKTWPILLPKTSDWIHIFCRWYKLLVWPDVNRMLSKLPCGFVFKSRYQFSFYFFMMFKKEEKKRIFIARSIYLFIRFLWLSNIMFYILQNDCRANTIWPVLQNHYYCITLVLICYKVRIQFQSINNWNNKFFVEGWVWNTLEMCYDERWEYIPLSFY